MIRQTILDAHRIFLSPSPGPSSSHPEENEQIGGEEEEAAAEQGPSGRGRQEKTEMLRRGLGKGAVRKALTLWVAKHVAETHGRATVRVCDNICIPICLPINRSVEPIAGRDRPSQLLHRPYKTKQNITGPPPQPPLRPLRARRRPPGAVGRDARAPGPGRRRRGVAGDLPCGLGPR